MVHVHQVVHEARCVESIDEHAVGGEHVNKMIPVNHKAHMRDIAELETQCVARKDGRIAMLIDIRIEPFEGRLKKAVVRVSGAGVLEESARCRLKSEPLID